MFCNFFIAVYTLPIAFIAIGVSLFILSMSEKNHKKLIDERGEEYANSYKRKAKNFAFIFMIGGGIGLGFNRASI